MKTLLGLLAMAVCDPEARALQTQFGGNMSPMLAKPCQVQGDFNGDGVMDQAWLVRLTGSVKPGVKLENPWHKGRPGGHVGLAIALSGKPGILYFLSDGEYFSSPMCQQPEGMISAKREGKGHVLLVATESGEDMRLRFDGKVWRLSA